MPRKTPGQKGHVPSAEQRKQAILQGVLRVVAEGGIDAVTHRRVAEEAGVPLASTTYYFGSRNEMLLAAFRRYIEMSVGVVFALGENHSGDDFETWLEAVVEYASGQLSDSKLLLAEYEMILFAARNEDFAREYQAWQRILASRVAEVLEGFGVATPLQAARAALAAYRGLELDCLAGSDCSPRTLKHRLRLLITGLVPATKGKSKARRNTKRGAEA